MIVDLKSFERKIEIDREVPVAAVGLSDERLHLAGPARIKGAIEKLSSGVRFVGSISAIGEIACDRCLEPISRPVAIDFDIEFLPAEAFTGDPEHEVAAEQLNADALFADEIDLAEVVREQILLETPQQIVCRDECKGICPQCGANRNLRTCDCDDREIDPRWAALKGLN